MIFSKDSEKKLLFSDIQSQDSNNPSKIKVLKLAWALIILFFILITSGVFAVVSIYDAKITGSWKVKESSTSTVFTFLDDNTVILTIDSLNISGKYNINNDKTITLDITLSGENVVSGTYSYLINSNFSSRTLTLIGPDEELIECFQYENKKIKSSENFIAFDPIVGQWKNQEKNIIYSFNKNGTGSLQKENITISFTYKVNENTIEISKVDYDELSSDSISYTLDNEILLIKGLPYTKQ